MTTTKNVNEKFLIWTNDPSEDQMNYELFWKDELEIEYPDFTESERIDLMYEINNNYLDDERCNLDINVGSPILIIADLGLWNGRKTGFRYIKSGNIKDCLYSDCDYCTWYVDGHGDLRCDAVHHDGTNHYLYRALKSNFSTDNGLIASIQEGEEIKRSNITRYTTRLGDIIAKVYGWPLKLRKETK